MRTLKAIGVEDFCKKYANAIKAASRIQRRLMNKMYNRYFSGERYQVEMMKALHRGDISHLEYQRLNKYKKPIVIRVVPRGMVLY